MPLRMYSLQYSVQQAEFISENFVILTSNLHFLCLTVLFCFGLARALLSDGHLPWLFLIIALFILFLVILGWPMLYGILNA